MINHSHKYKIRTFRTSLRTSGRQASGEEEGGKKNEMRCAHFFETINVIQNKKSVTAWHPPCRTISSRNSRKVDIVSLSPWVGVIVSVRVSGCVCLGPSSVSIEFKIQEQKRVWELCSDFVCIEVVLVVPPSWACCYLSCSWKQKTKKWRMTLKKCALQDSHDLVITSFWRYDLSLTWREDGIPFDLHIYV